MGDNLVYTIRVRLSPSPLDVLVLNLVPYGIFPLEKGQGARSLNLPSQRDILIKNTKDEEGIMIDMPLLAATIPKYHRLMLPSG